jgi:flagellar biosynthesis protein FlhB
MTPDRPSTVWAWIVLHLGAIYSGYSGYSTIYSLVTTVLFIRTLYSGIFLNIVQYFAYKAKLRKATQLYQETGQQSDRDIVGYASLNTLLLSVVFHVFGVFANGAGTGFALFGTPVIPNGADDTIKFI